MLVLIERTPLPRRSVHTRTSRAALVHAVSHTELNAIRFRLVSYDFRVSHPGTE